MLYRTMPKNGDKLSILGLGCMRLPGGQFRLNEAESVRLIRSAIDSGINYIDTAWPYHGGKSETTIAKAMQDGYRQRVKIADKLPYWLCNKHEDMDYYLNAQLDRLNDTVIDYYLLHAMDGFGWKHMVNMGVIDFLDRAKADGRIINAGFSFHGTAAEFKTIIDSYNWDMCMIQFNMLDEHNQAGIEGLDYASSKKIGVVVMEPLRGGILAGKQPAEVQKIYKRSENKRTNAEWALRWVWNHPGVITVLSGMSNTQQLDENLRIASQAEPLSLSKVENEIISQAASTLRSLMKTPCTGCQYCMPCPKGINIPMIFGIYNQRHLFRQKFSTKLHYLTQNAALLGRPSRLASVCVGCGKCMQHCPQHIDIPARLKDVKNDMEGWTTKPMLFLLKKSLKMGSKK